MASIFPARFFLRTLKRLTFRIGTFPSRGLWGPIRWSRWPTSVPKALISSCPKSTSISLIPIGLPSWKQTASALLTPESLTRWAVVFPVAFRTLPERVVAVRLPTRRLQPFAMTFCKFPLERCIQPFPVFQTCLPFKTRQRTASVMRATSASSVGLHAVSRGAQITPTANPLTMLPTVLRTKTFSPAATCPVAKSPLVEPRGEIVPFPHSTSHTHLTLSAFTTCPLVAGKDSSGMPGSRLISSSAGGPSQEWSASTADFPPLLRRRLQTTAAPPSRTTFGRTVFPECRLSILCSTQNT